MTFNGWPMLVLGTDQCLDSMHRTHSSLPLIYAYVRSEPALAYVNLMEAYPNVLLPLWLTLNSPNLCISVYTYIPRGGGGLAGMLLK